MATVEVIDAMEDILRQEGVYDDIKKTLFLAVDSVMKKKKPVLMNTKIKEFGATTDGKYSLLLIADLLENLNMKHSLEMFVFESGFTSTTGLKEGLKEKFGSFSVSGGPMLHQLVTGAAGDVRFPSHNAETAEHKESSGFPPRSPSHEESKSTHTKKNRSPLALHGGSPPSHHSTSFDLESSYDADDKSTTSMDRRHFTPDKEKKKKGGLSPLEPSHPKKSPLAILDKKGLSSAGGLPHLEPLVPHSKRSPLHKLSPHKSLSNEELSHDSLSSRKRHGHDHLEDSFEQSLEEKLEESKDGFEISDSFENSDYKLDSPLGKQSSHVLAPLGDVLSPHSTKSEKLEKSHTLEESQPEELASASFLEESEISEASNMFDDDECILLDSPKKSDTNPSPSRVQRVQVHQSEEKDTTDDPATTEDSDTSPVNVNVSSASTVQMMRSRVGWDDDEGVDRPEDDFEYTETSGGADSKSNSNDQATQGGSSIDSSGSGSDKNQDIHSEQKRQAKVDDYEENSDFESIENLDEYAEDMKYDEDQLLNDEDNTGLNTSHASYRSNQEEDEEENNRLEAKREDALNNSEQTAPSGSLFSSPTRAKKTAVGSPSPRSNKKKSQDDNADDEDDYGDDFDDDFEEDEEEAEELEESIAESLDEDLEEDNLSFGDNSSGGDSDKEKSYMSSPSHSPTGKLPSLFTKSNAPEESKQDKSFNDSEDSDPFQDKSGSFDNGPETSLASKDDLEDFSVGSESDNDEFLKDEDDESASAAELSVKDQKSVGKLGESNDFSMSENEISGSHNLNEFGVDYTTSAAPPASRRGGW